MAMQFSESLITVLWFCVRIQCFFVPDNYLTIMRQSQELLLCMSVDWKKESFPLQR